MNLYFRVQSGNRNILNPNVTVCCGVGIGVFLFLDWILHGIRLIITFLFFTNWFYVKRRPECKLTVLSVFPFLDWFLHALEHFELKHQTVKCEQIRLTDISWIAADVFAKQVEGEKGGQYVDEMHLRKSNYTHHWFYISLKAVIETSPSAPSLAFPTSSGRRRSLREVFPFFLC